METEDKVTRQLENYRDLAKENKDIDMTALAMNALAQAQQEEIAQGKKRRAYLVSVALPPLGLFYAAYYGLNGTSDGRRVAINCVIITALSLFSGWLIVQMFMSGITPAQTSQIQNINVEDIKGMLQQ